MQFDNYSIVGYPWSFSKNFNKLYLFLQVDSFLRTVADGDLEMVRSDSITTKYFALFSRQWCKMVPVVVSGVRFCCSARIFDFL